MTSMSEMCLSKTSEVMLSVDDKMEPIETDHEVPDKVGCGYQVEAYYYLI